MIGLGDDQSVPRDPFRAARRGRGVTVVARWDALRLAIAAALLTYVWRIQDLFPVLDGMKPVMVTTTLVVAFVLLDGRTLRRLGAGVRHPVAILTIVLGLLCVLSVPTSLWPGWSFDFVIKNALPTVALTLVVAAAIRDPADARRITAIQVAGAAIYSFIILTRFDVGPNGRLGNLVYYDANDLGMLLVCTLPLVVYFIRYGRWLVTRALCMGVAVLFISTIVKTGSRGAFLGLLATVAFILIRFRTVCVGTRLTVVAAIVVALFVGASGGILGCHGDSAAPYG